MAVSVEVLAVGQPGHAPVLLVVVDGTHCLINCPEGFQRLAIQQRIGFSRVSGVWATQLTPASLHGLPGLLYTAEASARLHTTHIFGPPRLGHWLRACRYFLHVPHMFLRVSEVPVCPSGRAKPVWWRLAAGGATAGLVVSAFALSAGEAEAEGSLDHGDGRHADDWGGVRCSGIGSDGAMDKDGEGEGATNLCGERFAVRWKQLVASHTAQLAKTARRVDTQLAAAVQAAAATGTHPRLPFMGCFPAGADPQWVLEPELAHFIALHAHPDSPKAGQDLAAARVQIARRKGFEDPEPLAGLATAFSYAESPIIPPPAPMSPLSSQSRDLGMFLAQDTVLAQAQHSVVVYRLSVPRQRGRFLPVAARALGVPPGPLFGRLARGEIVTVPDPDTGAPRAVHPEACLAPGYPPYTVIVLDLPGPAFLSAAATHPLLVGADDTSWDLVYHLAPASVVALPGYSALIHRIDAGHAAPAHRFVGKGIASGPPHVPEALADAIRGHALVDAHIYPPVAPWPVGPSEWPSLLDRAVALVAPCLPVVVPSPTPELKLPSNPVRTEPQDRVVTLGTLYPRAAVAGPGHVARLVPASSRCLATDHVFPRAGYLPRVARDPTIPVPEARAAHGGPFPRLFPWSRGENLPIAPVRIVASALLARYAHAAATRERPDPATAGAGPTPPTTSRGQAFPPIAQTVAGLRRSLAAAQALDQPGPGTPSSGSTLANDDFELVFLGTGAAAPSKHRNVSGFLLRLALGPPTEAPVPVTTIFDPGEDSLGQLTLCYPTPAIRRRVLAPLASVFISHRHADHHIGLLSLLAHRAQLVAPTDTLLIPVLIVAPRNTYGYLLELAACMLGLAPAAVLTAQAWYAAARPGGPGLAWLHTTRSVIGHLADALLAWAYADINLFTTRETTAHDPAAAGAPRVTGPERALLGRSGPGKSFTRPLRIRTTLCSCKLWPSPPMYEETSNPLVKRTRQTLRSAELGFFGVVV